MAKPALRDVSKAPAANINALAALIDEAGSLREQRTRADSAYKKICGEIEAQLVVPDQGQVTTEDGAEYVAKLAYQEVRAVKIDALFKKHPDLFWRLCTVPFQAMENVLGKNEAMKFYKNEFRDAPTLRIDKKR